MSENHEGAPKRHGAMRGPMGGPMRGPMGSGEKAKNFKGTISKLLNYIGGYKYAILVVIIFTIGSTVFTIRGPKMIGEAIQLVIEGLASKISGRSGMDFSAIGRILILLLTIYGISCLLSFLQGWIMAGVTQKISFRMRKEMSEKIGRIPMGYFESRTYGEVLSRITNDIDTLAQSLNQSVHQLITAVATIIGVFIMMLTISVTMTLITLLILPISAILVRLIFKHSQKFFRQQQEYLGHVNGKVEESYSGQTIIKLFNREEEVIKEFDETNNVLFESAWKSQFLSGMMQPLMQFVGNLGYVAVVIAGGYLALQGKLLPGYIQSFIQYVKNFTQPISQIAQISNLLQSTAAAAERVFEFMEEEEEKDLIENPLPDTVDVKALPGAVSFEHVKFGYLPNKTVIHNFSCDVKGGQKIAIVGPTGAGKTTIVKLLMRFYDVNSGAIRVDGYNVNDFDRPFIRGAFGMVLQDTWLFNGTIMENIRYGRLDATDEEVIEAAKAARVHKFIQTLPGGYQMELNEEASNISQGQKQLLTIARTILADRKILILDEATSSVDTRTEIEIQKAMDNLMEGRTSFIIAHRLSTIKNADLILVMREGDIVEQGNHEELLAKDGFYATLYNSQFEETA